MMQFVVSVKDSALGAYGRPLFVPSLGVAMRSFSDEVNRVAPDNQMNAHPEDFELWYLASFDEVNGTFVDPAIRMLARGKDVRRDAP